MGCVLLQQEYPVYRVLAYGFVGMTGFLVLLLAWFWWQESRAAARRRKLERRKA
jgi:Flp pilus assembly protein TadB